ncbi:MAG TPA: SCP2 sterol-binding domain-containing protein [Candidatus Bathyarchaeia archaeon]|nr:SCP2 sterol-binding domain-containing protein [Candidatus Bathyarchaeia archaeon]
MVTDEEIIVEINKLRDKLTDENLAKHFKSWNKTMQYYFPDIDTYWHLTMVNGQPGEPIKGKYDNPEIGYEITTEDFFALNRGEISGLKLFNQKRLKIKASMPDILKLQKLN